LAAGTDQVEVANGKVGIAAPSQYFLTRSTILIGYLNIFITVYGLAGAY